MLHKMHSAELTQWLLLLGRFDVGDYNQVYFSQPLPPLSEQSLGSAGRRHLLVPLAKTLVAAKSLQPKKSHMLDPLWLKPDSHLLAASVDTKVTPALSQWQQTLACCWLLPNSSHALMFFQSSVPPRCISPQAMRRAQELGLVTAVPFWAAHSTTPKKTHPGARGNRRAPRPLLLPYDKRLSLQQVVERFLVERFLYLALEFRWLHPSSRCCVLICCLHLQADAGQALGRRLLWASGHGRSGGDWQRQAKRSSDRGSEDVER